MSIIKGMMEKTAGLRSASDIEVGSTKKSSGPVSAPGMMAQLALANSEIADLKRKLENGGTKAKLVRIDRCVDGASHPMPVDPVRVAALKANLANNPQSSPGIVRVLPNNKLEIIAGRHRMAALKELGFIEWWVVEAEFTDDEADRLTFYDNLLAPHLSDFGRFRGFEMRKRKGFTIEELAAESGLSKTLVGNLLAFAKLPEPALTLIEKHPVNFGANLVAKLAPLSAEFPAEVTKVVELVANGELSQDRAPAHVMALRKASSGKSTTGTEAPKMTAIESETGQYATVELKAKSLTIRLQTKEEAVAVAEVVRKALETRAKKIRS